MANVLRCAGAQPAETETVLDGRPAIFLSDCHSYLPLVFRYSPSLFSCSFPCSQLHICVFLAFLCFSSVTFLSLSISTIPIFRHSLCVFPDLIPITSMADPLLSYSLSLSIRILFPHYS